MKFLCQIGRKYEQNCEKREIESREEPEIIAFFRGIVADIFPKRDETGERRDERTRTADIDAEQKTAIVGRKAGEQNGGRNVADDLTGERADHERVLFEQGTQKSANRFHARKVACKNEEANERKEQSVVHLRERATIQKQQDDGNDT